MCRPSGCDILLCNDNEVRRARTWEGCGTCSAIMVAKSGTVVNARRLAADNEECAVQQAKAMVGGDTVELWDGLRFIERFSPVD